jgi:hypothetical protein
MERRRMVTSQRRRYVTDQRRRQQRLALTFDDDFAVAGYEVLRA